MAGPSADDSQVFFEMAHKSLVHRALSKPGAGDDWVLFNGLSTIATGLEILSAELKATARRLPSSRPCCSSRQSALLKRRMHYH